MATAEHQSGPGRPRGRFTQRYRFDALRELLVQRPRGMTLQEIAEILHITPRSARRYLDEIRREVEKASSGGRSPLWRLKATSRPRKIGLRPMQVYSLLAVRRVFDVLRGSALHDEFDVALRSLGTLARQPSRSAGAPWPDTHLEDRFLYVPDAPAEYPGQGEDLDVLVLAAAELHPVTCGRREMRDKDSRLTLHPYAVVLYQEAVHIVARHLEEDSVTVFPLQALTDVQAVTDKRFEIPLGFDLGAYFPRAFGVQLAARKVRVVIDFDARAASAIRARRFSPTQRRSNLRGGGVRLTMAVGDLSEVARWVIGFGDQARVVEPEALRERVIRELRDALALYRDRKSQAGA